MGGSGPAMNEAPQQLLACEPGLLWACLKDFIPEKNPKQLIQITEQPFAIIFALNIRIFKSP